MNPEAQNDSDERLKGISDPSQRAMLERAIEKGWPIPPGAWKPIKNRRLLALLWYTLLPRPDAVDPGRETPDSYWNPENIDQAVVNPIVGTFRRSLVERAIASDQADRLEDDVLAPKLSRADAAALESIHPSFGGGEQLPPLLPGEVEIARVELNSVRHDVTSVRARPADGGIAYRIVDEYEHRFIVKPGFSASPLSLRELIALMDNARMEGEPQERGIVLNHIRFCVGEGGAETSEQREELEHFVTVTSCFYGGLDEHYQSRIPGFIVGCRLGLASGWARRNRSPYVAPDLVVHVPHASTALGEAGPLLATEDEIREELLHVTDWFTDELFQWKDAGMTAVVFGQSRLVVDVERFRDDAQEPMSAMGRGAIYTSLRDGRPLRQPATGMAYGALMTRYEQHHGRLRRAVDDALLTNGRCLILDAHSFPSQPWAIEPNAAGDRPDICLGTDPDHTPPWLADAARLAFEKQGFAVAFNTPYAGTLVPRKHLRTDRRVHSIMVELNRKLYLDEATAKRLPCYVTFHARLKRALRKLAATWREHKEPAII